MLSWPLRAPLAVGVNAICTVQLVPVATAVPQVPPLRAKSPLVDTLIALIELPLFRLALTVMVCAAEVTPTTVEGKLKLPGVFPR